MAASHEDKFKYTNSTLKLSKSEWERIFGKPEDVKVKKGKASTYKEDFTNGGLNGKNRGWV
jgi:hypothetical protein